MKPKYVKMTRRYSHGAAALSINSKCVEVVLFGGRRKFCGSTKADTAVLRFGESYSTCILTGWHQTVCRDSHKSVVISFMCSKCILVDDFY